MMEKIMVIGATIIGIGWPLIWFITSARDAAHWQGMMEQCYLSRDDEH